MLIDSARQAGRPKRSVARCSLRQSPRAAVAGEFGSHTLSILCSGVRLFDVVYFGLANIVDFVWTAKKDSRESQQRTCAGSVHEFRFRLCLQWVDECMMRRRAGRLKTPTSLPRRTWWVCVSARTGWLCGQCPRTWWRGISAAALAKTQPKPTQHTGYSQLITNTAAVVVARSKIILLLLSMLDHGTVFFSWLDL